MATEKTILDRLGWEIIGTLGEGGQAKVHLVKKKGQADSPEYALKVVRTETGKQSYARFHREIEALKKVDHPGIVKIVDHGSDESEGLHFYVMEYVKGLRSLKKIVGAVGNPFFEDAAKSVTIYIRILDALHACEKASIVHRDLSLGNVMITSDNQNVKLIDFGCCFVEDGNLITLTDEAVGTPGYRAPECENATDGPTIKADLYSAGKILWSIITNKKAFHREKPVFTHQALDKVLPNVPMTWHLYHIFEKTVRHSQDNRYKNATEAIEKATFILERIRAEYPPLEKLDEHRRCPACGIGQLGNAGYLAENCLVNHEMTKMGIGDPELSKLFQFRPHVKDMTVCTYCGFSCNLVPLVRERNLKYRESLD